MQIKKNMIEYKTKAGNVWGLVGKCVYGSGWIAEVLLQTGEAFSISGGWPRQYEAVNQLRQSKPAWAKLEDGEQ